MKVKIENLGNSYRVYELAYTEPLRWPTGEELNIHSSNMKFLMNEKQLKELENGGYTFNVSVNRIGYLYRVFGSDPKMFAEVSVEETLKQISEAAEKQQGLETAAADATAVVDNATLTPKF